MIRTQISLDEQPTGKRRRRPDGRGFRWPSSYAGRCGWRCPHAGAPVAGGATV